MNICRKKKNSRWEAPSRQVHFHLYITFRKTVSNFFQIPTKCVMYLYYSEFSRFILCVCLACQSCIVCDSMQLSRILFIEILIALDDEKTPKVSIAAYLVNQTLTRRKKKNMIARYPLFVLLIYGLPGQLIHVEPWLEIATKKSFLIKKRAYIMYNNCRTAVDVAI